jgi:photosystem II stability/assembly factor-like uncharacterized protein
MNLHLFPKPGADGHQSSFVRSTTSAEVAQVPDFTTYSQSTIRFKPVQQAPTGAFNQRVSAFTATGYTALCWVFTKAANAEAVVLGASSTMTWNASGYFDGVLDLNTEEAIAATEDLAAGSGLDVWFAFALLDGSSQPEIVMQRTRLFWAPPPDDLPAPTSVTSTIFANLLASTGLWEDGVLSGQLRVESPATTTHGNTTADTTYSDAVTVAGHTGRVYQKTFRVRGLFGLTTFTGGTNIGTINVGGTHSHPTGNPISLTVSDPPQVVYLNRGVAAADRAPRDFLVTVMVRAGATLTLLHNTVDNGLDAWVAAQYVPGVEPYPAEFDGWFIELEEVPETKLDQPTYEALSFSAAGNTDVTPGSSAAATHRAAHHTAVITVAAGAGAYVRTVSLLTTNRKAGDTVTLGLLMPASANPTVEVRSGSSSGTLLQSVTGEVTGSDYHIHAVFNGVAWELLPTSSAAASSSGETVLATVTTTDNTPTDLVVTRGSLLLDASTCRAFSVLGKAFAGGTGATWTPRDSVRNWSAIVASSDGVKQVANSGGNTYTSGDSGATWTARNPGVTLGYLASSADGTKLVSGVNGGNIYTSTDSGVTWVDTGENGSAGAWTGFASSSDGVKLVAVENNGQIYTSTDSGATWTARDSVRLWVSVASSSDGTKLVATVAAGQIYTSTNSGATWTARDSARSWGQVASSTDGVNLVAVVTSSGQIYTSTDSGVNWTPRDSARNWAAVASSSDGSKLLAAETLGFLYTSTDSGVTWTPRDSARIWLGVACAADFSVLSACVGAGYIYTSGSTALEVDMWRFDGFILRNAAVGTAAAVVVPGAYTAQTTWTMAVAEDTSTGALKITFTGENGKTIVSEAEIQWL